MKRLLRSGRKVRTALALSIGAAAASLVPLQAAVADSSPADPYFSFAVQDPAILVARGAAVDVSVRVTCYPEAFGSYMEIHLAQRVAANRVVRGFAFVNPTVCDGFPHVITTRMFAEQFAFKPGAAAVSTYSFACTPLQCNQFVEETVINLRNR